MIYVFQNPETKEIREVFQNMHDEHVYYTEENGKTIKWNRVFTVPNTSVDSKIDPYSKKSYLEKTSNLNGTYGDLQDISRELSEKRAKDHGGKDPLKEKYFKKYAEKRNGKQHPEAKKKKISTDFCEVSI